MKTNFFKTTPFALVAVLGLSGAFLTTSMQSAPKDDAYRMGWIDGDIEPCSVPVDCSTDDGPLCQADGQQAFGKDNNCTETLRKYNP
ncbi:hypothetical protein DM790_17080 [Flavobacterium collinsii]|nr:hypothetical protein [Flavobacterium collinsii]